MLATQGQAVHADRLLILCRIGAWALNSLTNQLGMGNYAHTFVGDDPDAWLETNMGLKALINGKSVAELELNSKYWGERLPSQGQITIANIFSIVRPKYLGEFNPMDHGVIPNYDTDWKGEKTPDLVASINMEDPDRQIPSLFAPRNYMPQQTTKRKPRVIGSLNK